MRALVPVVVAVLGSLALAAPAAAEHECSMRGIEVSAPGGLREASLTGGGSGPLAGPRVLEVGAPVAPHDLQPFQPVVAGGVTKVTIGRYVHVLRPSPGKGRKPVFLISCVPGMASERQVRLLEGRVDVDGPAIPAGSRRSYGVVSTPEAGFLPTPGRVDYRVVREAFDSARRTSSLGKANLGGSTLFVRTSSLLRDNAGRKIRCRRGESVEVFADGDVETS